MIFESVDDTRGYAEPVDVRSGEYGDHGWDADGKPVALVATPSARQVGLIGRLLGLEPELEVSVREVELPAEPEMLREALLGRLSGLESDLVAAAEGLGLDDLIDLLRRSTSDALQRVREGRYRK